MPLIGLLDFIYCPDPGPANQASVRRFSGALIQMQKRRGLHTSIMAYWSVERRAHEARIRMICDV